MKSMIDTEFRTNGVMMATVIPATAMSFKSGVSTITTEVSRPPARANGGVVIIAHGSDGITDHLNGPWKTMIEGYADALAMAEFIVSVPHYFEKSGTAPPVRPDQILRHRDDWQAALDASVSHGKTLTGVDPSRIGLLGFSLGGHLCLRLRGSAKVLVEFFAPELDEIGASGALPLHAQIHHGEADQLVPFKSNGQPIYDTLRASNPASTELYTYEGAGHGFAQADPDNTNARNLSKERTIKFFQTHL